MKKNNVSLYLNLLIIIFEIAAFTLNVIYGMGINAEFYTEDSNLLLLISSLLFVIFTLYNKKIPKWLSILKYIATIGVTLTFVVVLFILAPMAGYNFKLFMFGGTLIFHHTLCPLLGAITFMLFDDLGEFNTKDIVLGLSFTIIYSIVLVILNIIEVIEGPYPFLMVRSQSIIMSIIWILSIYFMAYFVAYIMRFIYIKKRS